jgi:hypothetical protein
LKYPIPNSTFQPDWDVIQGIVGKMAQFSINTTIVHVKGHQDKKVPFAQLGLLAQLNVEANKYAGIYHTHLGDHCSIIPLSPTCPVALDIQGWTVQRRGFKSTICEAVHGPHLLEAMQLQYNWPNGFIETIDWEAHPQALQAHSNYWDDQLGGTPPSSTSTFELMDSLSQVVTNRQSCYQRAI